eukprot:3353-Heterococcus_DN1.PRE.1
MKPCAVKARSLSAHWHLAVENVHSSSRCSHSDRVQHVTYSIHKQETGVEGIVIYVVLCDVLQPAGKSANAPVIPSSTLHVLISTTFTLCYLITSSRSTSIPQPDTAFIALHEVMLSVRFMQYHSFTQTNVQHLRLTISNVHMIA